MVLLRNGVAMPRVVLGMGPWCNGHDCYNDSAAAADVRLAFSVGFTGVDEALGYGNQVGVGQAFAEYDRKAVWMTSKVPGCHRTMTLDECASETAANFDTVLAQLNLSYVDLMLLHSPPSSGPGTACGTTALCALARAQAARYTAGQARAIGVSNFCGTCLECLSGIAPAPHVNQVQYHAGMPGADPAGIATACATHGVELQAYSPLGSYVNHSLISNNVTIAIGARYNKSSAQVGLRWVLQHNHSLAVAASNPAYLREDLDIFDWSLSASDMRKLDTQAIAPQDPTRGVCK